MIHQPVLVEAIVRFLVQQRGGLFVDATLGAGGHAKAILESAGPSARVVAVDQDPDALVAAAQTLQGMTNQVIFKQRNFDHLPALLDELGILEVDGILLDLGLSSMQLAVASRGFSFQREGPLDMRMDPTQPLSAATIVNTWSEDALSDLIARFGQDGQARRIARAIVQARPLTTTTALAECIVRALPRREALRRRRDRGPRIHPATRTFQALRIAVNRELDALETVLPQGITRLRPGGRLAVLSYHSLEDRIVKQAFRRAAVAGVFQVLTPKPQRPPADEIRKNPRARSARLRVGERIR